MLRLLSVLLAIICLSQASVTQQPFRPRAVAPGVWLLPGSFDPNREPDGNTVIFAGPKGLIVMDTGRHARHTQAIIKFAHVRKQPVVAVINSHWHLDHTSGNSELKRAFPAAKFYASTAIEAAIRDFFPKSSANDKAYLASGSANPETAEDLRADLDIMAAPRALRPDVAISRSGPVTVGELSLEIHYAPNAATDGDLWVYSSKTRMAAVGDLVTLPVPFLDTACVGGWQRALREIDATDFHLVIPGHGEPMTRSQFETYREAFAKFARCASSDRAATDCAADWLRSVAAIPGASSITDQRSQSMGRYYVDLLRAHHGNSEYCKAS